MKARISACLLDMKLDVQLLTILSALFVNTEAAVFTRSKAYSRLQYLFCTNEIRVQGFGCGCGQPNSLKSTQIIVLVYFFPNCIFHRVA